MTFEAILAAIECKICCEISNIKSLPCGHSLCDKCIDSTTEEGRNFKCHFCNQKKRMPKGGFPKNFSVNDISDAVRAIKFPCLSHPLFPMNLKCMTCVDHPELCLQCFQTDHCGHYVTPSDWTVEKGLEKWKQAFSNGPNSNRIEQRVVPSHTDVSTQSTLETDEKPSDGLEQMLSNDLQRGDCVLYLYRSQNNGEIYLGIAVIHNVLDSSQISSRYHLSLQQKQEIEKEAMASSSHDSYDQKIKRRRVDDALEEIRCRDILLKLSPLSLQGASSTSTSSSSGDTYNVVIVPSHRPLIDVPYFSVISSNITILLSGLLSPSCSPASLRLNVRRAIVFRVAEDCDASTERLRSQIRVTSTLFHLSSSLSLCCGIPCP
jgi:hypothetical protein